MIKIMLVNINPQHPVPGTRHSTSATLRYNPAARDHSGNSYVLFFFFISRAEIIYSMIITVMKSLTLPI